MKTKNDLNTRRDHGFTLIELLVVIAIIAILAALLFPAGAAIQNSAKIKRAYSELERIETAIATYKAEYGHYPPDNALTPIPQYAINPLYFELLGTELKNNGADYETKDGTARIAVGNVPATFGRGGFVNCTRSSDADNSKPAKRYVQELRPNQSGENAAGVRLLACSIQWPAKLGNGVAGVPDLNPWRYNSSNPTNNSGAFDLWVDIHVGGKTNRISNWSKKPQIVF